jgi:hypothetical protein
MAAYPTILNVTYVLGFQGIASPDNSQEGMDVAGVSFVNRALRFTINVQWNYWAIRHRWWSLTWPCSRMEV